MGLFVGHLVAVLTTEPQDKLAGGTVTADHLDRIGGADDAPEQAIVQLHVRHLNGDAGADGRAIDDPVIADNFLVRGVIELAHRLIVSLRVLADEQPFLVRVGQQQIVGELLPLLG
ncbi:hypothetical protein D3C84_833540 [compost metagenome]